MGSKATREIAPHIEKHGRDAVLAKIEKHSFFEPNTGCQLWVGPSVTGGYGTTHVNSTTFLAHRVNYVLHNGEIPAGLTLDHLCKQTCCINPLHLEAVTMKENTMRGTSFSRVNAEKTHCSRGHEYTEETVFKYKDGRRECRICQRINANAGYHRNKKLKGYCVGENRPGSKLNKQIVLEIRSSSLTISELSKIYGVNRTSISNVRKGISWKHIE